MRGVHQLALSTAGPTAFKISAVLPLLVVIFCSWLRTVPAAPPASESAADFPLALKTKWTNHLHQEMGEGARFGPLLSKFAKGNSLDVSVITEVVGSDVIHGEKFIRRETRVKGALWLTEWLRQTPNGLLLAKSFDSEQGQEALMDPPEKLLSATLKTGESWDWKAADASMVMHIKVAGSADLTVPAGTFHATQVSYDAAVETEGGTVTIHQGSWFLSGVGYIKQETETRLGDQLLSHVVQTLEKYEPAPTARPGGA